MLQLLLWLLVGVVLLGVLIFGHTGFTFSLYVPRLGSWCAICWVKNCLSSKILLPLLEPLVTLRLSASSAGYSETCRRPVGRGSVPLGRNESPAKSGDSFLLHFSRPLQWFTPGLLFVEGATIMSERRSHRVALGRTRRGDAQTSRIVHSH